MKTAKKKPAVNIAIIGTNGHPLPLADFKKILPKGKNFRLIFGTFPIVDREVWDYAAAHKLKYWGIVPKLTAIENIRNVIKSADKVLIFWDGESEKTETAIKECIAMKKDFTLYTTYEKF